MIVAFATVRAADDHVEFTIGTSPNKSDAINVPLGVDKTPSCPYDVTIICIDSALFEVYYATAGYRRLWNGEQASAPPSRIDNSKGSGLVFTRS